MKTSIQYAVAIVRPFFIESTTYVFMFPQLAAELKISSKILSLAELVNEVILSTNTDKTD